MLSRTADHLFWLARYIERAENTARMLDMSHQMAMMPQSLQMAQRSWRATLEIFNQANQFDGGYEFLSQHDVLYFMCFDPQNPASIHQSLYLARENAKAVRGSLSLELWQAINSTWLEYQEWQTQTIHTNDYLALYDWIKMRSHLQNGIQNNTIYHDDVYHFLSLGTYLERADNISRLLDVKFYTLGIWLDDQRDAASYADFYHWATVLKAVSAFEAFRKIDSEAITPEKVIDLLVFNTHMPRSLAYSMEKVHFHLQKLRTPHSQPIERMVGALATGLRYGFTEEKFVKHLHAYLADFLGHLQQITEQISQSFMLNVKQYS